MEKENVIINDDELKDVSGGATTGWDMLSSCRLFNRRDVCEKDGDKCYWNISSGKCMPKQS